MAIPQTLGERIRVAVEATFPSHSHFAEAMDVHPKTVSRWVNGKQEPDSEALERIASLLDTSVAWLRYGEAHGRQWAELSGPPVLREKAKALPRSWPHAARVLVQDFIAEAVRMGATEDDEGWIRRTLLSPESAVVYRGGRPRDLTEEELLKELGGLVEGLRVWLREAIRRRRETGQSVRTSTG